ncbi:MULTISPECIES: hypothetical protein [Rhodopseudomonas]|uniref:hypothetical protein n=1 Tax=Rhodopseudomonas TaxID=1073 RepID=UPI00128AFFE4|nr:MULTISPECIES: hypothetical protein [Rhodopseudomonas]MDF3811049.1 hypothetical protein [Rhodopseudomonas sp. BAL398]WOK15945.1 hypothetical protein RBJ75_17430 [Rhodopseudomonas sp. BAL398]
MRRSLGSAETEDDHRRPSLPLAERRLPSPAAPLVVDAVGYQDDRRALSAADHRSQIMDRR